eukprot:763312-Hanusia_phi.AAC.3
MARHCGTVPLTVTLESKAPAVRRIGSGSGSALAWPERHPAAIDPSITYTSYDPYDKKRR